MKPRLAMLALLAIAATADAAAPADASWEVSARTALTAALVHAKPAVVAWELRALLGHRQRERLVAAQATEVHIARLGARSAVTVQRAGGSATTVWFAVQGTMPVLVTTRDVAPGHGVAAGDARIEARDVMAVACEPLVDPAQLESMRARTPLRAGSIVCREHVEPRPAVARGERVLVHSSVGRVHVTGSAIAEQDGAIGDVLQVRHPSSRSRYLAQVTGPQEVTVDE